MFYLCFRIILEQQKPIEDSSRKTIEIRDLRLGPDHGPDVFMRIVLYIRAARDSRNVSFAALRRPWSFAWMSGQSKAEPAEAAEAAPAAASSSSKRVPRAELAVRDLKHWNF